MNNATVPAGPPELPPSVLHAIYQAVGNTQAARYNYLALAICFLYDMSLTFADEVEFIWMRPASLLKYLFIANRYLSLLQSIFSPSIFLYTGLNLSRSVRAGFLIWQSAEALINLAIIDAILIIRIWGMYAGSRAVLLFLSVFAAIGWAASVVLMSVSLSRHPIVSQPDPGFVVCAGTLPSYFAAYWIPILAVDLTFAGFMVYKGYLNWRADTVSVLTGISGRHLANLLVRDSVMYYLFINAVYGMNAAMWFWAPETLIEAAAPWGIFLPTIMVARLVLNIKADAERGRGSGDTTELTTFDAAAYNVHSGTHSGSHAGSGARGGGKKMPHNKGSINFAHSAVDSMGFGYGEESEIARTEESGSGGYGGTSVEGKAY
ncbi:hypothetical protein PUNSTDRAFT_54795 [Punctularia strigosozonata HHB-11173 SS5]|uniref:uncharacterized protein n=1 Tax=Punctularia strigosozonata (strain HHB-11173) TaxID=741275 RepID=UPI000441856E|nr:uncharacterized protein PUNSTDRAFT_54795 [Punctularia strigosozonata HHB-11173 SS5]EIN05363.1 hypothetical protein PUNSTDRAFT_54795 [Punctularia strigosozonata HHB-11173 SS5]